MVFKVTLRGRSQNIRSQKPAMKAPSLKNLKKADTISNQRVEKVKIRPSIPPPISTMEPWYGPTDRDKGILTSPTNIMQTIDPIKLCKNKPVLPVSLDNSRKNKKLPIGVLDDYYKEISQRAREEATDLMVKNDPVRRERAERPENDDDGNDDDENEANGDDHGNDDEPAGGSKKEEAAGPKFAGNNFAGNINNFAGDQNKDQNDFDLEHSHGNNNHSRETRSGVGEAGGRFHVVDEPGDVDKAPNLQALKQKQIRTKNQHTGAKKPKALQINPSTVDG